MTKKERERRVFEIYLSENHINPDKVIWDHERPDFIFCVNQETVACEITQFDWNYNPNGSNQRKRDEFLKNLHFKLSIELVKKFPLNKEIVIEYIPVQIAKSKIDIEVKDVIKRVEKTEQVLNPSASVRRVTFNRIDGNSTCIYLSFKDGNSNPYEKIQDIISHKEKSKLKWPKQYKQSILLIYIGWEFSSIIPTNRIQSLEINNSSWDQIFVIDIAERKSYNIRKAT